MQMHNQKTRPRGSKINAGMSLIELLIALVLGMTLAAGVIQVYVGSTTTERSQEARLRMQEGGRFGINFLSQEIRMAGYLGCLGSIEGTSANNLLDGPPTHFQPGWGIQGWEAAGTGPGVTNNSTLNVAQVATSTSEWSTGDPNIVMPVFNAVPNSDIVRVWGGSGTAGTVSVITQGVTPTITVETNAGISGNDFLLISDCEQVDIAQACVVVAGTAPATTSIISLSTGCSPGNVSGALITSITDVGALAEVIRLQGTVFYVGKRGGLAANPPALFRAQLANDGTLAAAEELIEGVESMQILYGVNTDEDIRSTADAYLTADLVTQWQDVISVRITLLMQSIDDGTVPQPQGYSFNGVVYDGAAGGSLPADRRVRRIFTTTISLRNRALGV
jgi:type IV pilus assembly protein PilW